MIDTGPGCQAMIPAPLHRQSLLLVLTIGGVALFWTSAMLRSAAEVAPAGILWRRHVNLEIERPLT